MTLNEESMKTIIRARTRRDTLDSFRYFWASFALQILVYSLLSHVIVKNFGDGLIMIPAMLGIAVYIPFTVMLMKKFKSMALLKGAPVNSYVEQQYDLLKSFYQFKKRYEMILIPLATLIGTFVVFEIWVPGGIWMYPKGAMITFFVTLASCIIAIREENKKSFDIPLSKLKLILDDINSLA